MSQEKRAKKLVLILATSILVIIIRKKAIRNAGIDETSKNSRNSKNGEKGKNLKTNFIQIPYISYLITF